MLILLFSSSFWDRYSFSDIAINPINLRSLNTDPLFITMMKTLPVWKSILIQLHHPIYRPIHSSPTVSKTPFLWCPSILSRKCVAFSFWCSSVSLTWTCSSVFSCLPFPCRMTVIWTFQNVFMIRHTSCILACIPGGNCAEMMPSVCHCITAATLPLSWSPSQVGICQVPSSFFVYFLIFWYKIISFSSILYFPCSAMDHFSK